MTATALQSWILAAQATTDFQLIRAVQETIAGIAQQVPSEEGLTLTRVPNNRDATFDSLRRLATDPDISGRLIESLGPQLEQQTAELTREAPPPPHESISSSFEIGWFQRITSSGSKPGVLHLLRQTVAAFLRDPNRGLDPMAAHGHTRVVNHPPSVQTAQDGTDRLRAVGWDTRVEAIRQWRDEQLRTLPNSQTALEKVLTNVQWFRAQVAGRLDSLLPAFSPTSAEKEGLYGAILAYQDNLSRWLSQYNEAHAGTDPLTRLDVEFALERELWTSVRTDAAAAASLSDQDLIARGLSPLALTVLQVYDRETKRAPIQALPESTIRYILTQNPHLKDTPEAATLLAAAENYHGAGKRPDVKFIEAYVQAMQGLLADPVRARHFLVELSFVDTARNLILQDPNYILEDILKEHADEIFSAGTSTAEVRPPAWIAAHQSLEQAIASDDLEAIRVSRVNLNQVRSQLGQRLFHFLIEAAEKLEKAKTSKDPLAIARAKQIHDNLLSILMFHFGPRLIPFMTTHRRFANLRPERPGLNEVESLRRGLYVERENLARLQRDKWEAAVEQVNGLWNGLHDPGLAQLHESVFQYLIQFSDELIDKVRTSSPGTYRELETTYRHARDRAQKAMEDFSMWETRRLAHVARRSGLDVEMPDQVSFVPRDYNRAIERALQALLGTQPEVPIVQKRASRKTRKTPGLLEVAQNALRTAGLPEADIHPVVPLFAAFASNYRPLSKEERKRVSLQNPKHALAGLIGGRVADLFAGERRGDGNDYGDMRLLEWSIAMGNQFHHNTIVADPLTVGGLLTHFSAPVIDSKHSSWGGDFNAMVQIAAAVSPNSGDPIRMRPPRILAKGDLSKMIPIFGLGIKHFTIPVLKGVYRGVEVRAARSIAHGDVLHDISLLENAGGLSSFQRTHVASRPAPRPIGVFSEITMPVSDAMNPYDPTREGSLAAPPISSPLPPIGRGTYISLMAEAISGKPQMMLWPVPNGSFATFPKPDARIRLYRGRTKTIVPDPIFNDALPNVAGVSTSTLADFLLTVGNLQRSVWWLNAMVPENLTPVPQEAEYLGNQEEVIP